MTRFLVQSRLDLSISRGGRRSGMDTLVGAADCWSSPLWSGPRLAMPGFGVRRPAWTSYGHGAAPLVDQKSLLLRDKIHLCRFN